MFNLTRQERVVLIFLAATLAAGAAVKVWGGKKASPPPAPIVREWDLTTPKPAPVAPSPTAASTVRIDPNVASEAELATLPGIGPVLAGRIVAYRAHHPLFRRAADLARVNGISAEMAAKLAPHLTLNETNH